MLIRVLDSNKNKKKIFVRTNRKNHNSKDNIDKIEDGKSVTGNNLANRVVLSGFGSFFARKTR